MEYNAYLTLACQSELQLEQFIRLLDKRTRPDFEDEVRPEDLSLWQATQSIEPPDRFEKKAELDLDLIYEQPPWNSDELVDMSEVLSKLCNGVSIFIDCYDWGGYQEWQVKDGVAKCIKDSDYGDEEE